MMDANIDVATGWNICDVIITDLNMPVVSGLELLEN
jgi:CheY-like chemotaxis protein